MNDVERKPNCTKGAGRVVIEMSPFKVWRRGQGVIGVGVGESDDDNKRVACTLHMHNQLMFSLDFKFNDLTSYNRYQLFYDNFSRSKKDLKGCLPF